MIPVGACVVLRSAEITDVGYSKTSFPRAPKIFGSAVADSGKEFHHAMKGDFIARIGHEAMNDVTSLMCACSKNRMPLVIWYGMPRRESSNCSSSA